MCGVQTHACPQARLQSQLQKSEEEDHRRQVAYVVCLRVVGDTVVHSDYVGENSPSDGDAVAADGGSKESHGGDSDDREKGGTVEDKTHEVVVVDKLCVDAVVGA